MVFQKKNKMLTLGYIEDLKDTYISLLNSIEEDTLDSMSAKNYFRHIPNRSKNAGWPEEVYKIADKCHKMLYEYCKKKGIISVDTSYDMYLNKNCF